MRRSIAAAFFLVLAAHAAPSHTALVERAEAGDAAAQFELGKQHARGGRRASWESRKGSAGKGVRS